MRVPEITSFCYYVWQKRKVSSWPSHRTICLNAFHFVVVAVLVVLRRSCCTRKYVRWGPLIYIMPYTIRRLYPDPGKWNQLKIIIAVLSLLIKLPEPISYKWCLTYFKILQFECFFFVLFFSWKLDNTFFFTLINH